MKAIKTILKSKHTDQFALVLVFLLHVGATFIFLPPWEAIKNEPLRFVDHPVHTHRIFIYRRGLMESGIPWGYDPAISAGTVVDPAQDAGAKPQQIFGLIFFFLSPGMIERLCTFAVTLTFPVWTFLVCRRLNVPLGAQVWVLISLIGPTWLVRAKPFMFPRYFEFGLIAYTAANYYVPYVLFLFLDFFTTPNAKSYWKFCLSATFLFLLHVLGIVPLIPVLIIYVLVRGGLPARWRRTSLFTPLFMVAVNAFWFVPLILAAFITPESPWPKLPELAGPPDLTFTSWQQLLAHFSVSRSGMAAVAAAGLTFYGLFEMRKLLSSHIVKGFTITIAFTLFVYLFGSFLPLTVFLQPTRFIIPLLAFASLPVGIAVYSLATKIRFPPSLCAMGFAILVSIVARLEGEPRALELPLDPDPLEEFVKEHTTPDDRLMVQERQDGDHRCKILPYVFHREIIGSTRPASDFDPAQFRAKTVFGKRFESWSPHEFRQALERWGVTWVFTYTEKAQKLLSETMGSNGVPAGGYQAFEIPGSPSRFLIGSGRVKAKINSLELTDLHPENGLIVIRYRYHPAWTTPADLAIHHYPLPEDPIGFIALRNPPKDVTLRFRPWKLLTVQWPETLRSKEKNE